MAPSADAPQGRGSDDKGALSGCLFRGHVVKIVTGELESG